MNRLMKYLDKCQYEYDMWLESICRGEENKCYDEFADEWAYELWLRQQMR